MKILDPDGNELPAGETGEVYMRADSGPGSTYQYLGAEAEAIGEWETLGDMGYFDADGYLFLGDRRKDLILRGGPNIYPAEVEAALDAHTAVRSSAVIGLRDDEYGQLVHAIVDAPGGVDEATLRAHMAEQLVAYKLPSTYEFVDEPLRDEAGKVRRSQLAAERSS